MSLTHSDKILPMGRTNWLFGVQADYAQHLTKQVMPTYNPNKDKIYLSGLTSHNLLPDFAQPVEGILKVKRTAAPQQIKLAYFGKLKNNKGLDLLLKGLAALPPSDDLVLDIWGIGKEKANLEQLAKLLSLTNTVNFKGDYPGKKQGAQLMVSYDGLVLTSTKNENLPLVLLQSMAYGVPFMATNVGIVYDCCVGNNDSVLIQPTQDNITIGLAVLIHGIQNNRFNPERLRKYYEQRFSAQALALRWEGCFDNPRQFFS